VGLLVLVVLLGGAWYGGTKAFDKLKEHFAAAPDYSGPGTGSVVVQVKQGDSSTAIANQLKAAGVTESVQAFIDAARKDPQSTAIQVGYYQLKKKMKATDALAVLVDHKNLIQSVVTIPEGSRLKSIAKIIADKTDITPAAVQAALKNPSSIGLPAAANGNAEGWLFPATYTIVPHETATDLLKQMVAKTSSTLSDLDAATLGKQYGLSEENVLTVASILEFEAKRNEDFPKVARAIYNRLKAGMPLQSDATVAYANGLSGTVFTTDQQRQLNSPYNTYLKSGLPPGPIGAPGATTLKAALHPTPGPWLYWIAVNLETGKTLYSVTYAEHQRQNEQLIAYCKTSSLC
jgi:UPF0755 protein